MMSLNIIYLPQVTALRLSALF